MNRGIFPGLNPDGWRDYLPVWKCVGNLGDTITQPIANDLGSQRPRFVFGRYNILDKRLVVAEMMITLVGAAAGGIGPAYVWSLPFPAKRWTGDGAVSPVPIGHGMTYWSFVNSAVPWAGLPAVPTLADPFPTLAGQEDSYFQAFAPYGYDQGEATINAGATDTTETHGFDYAPAARDIQFVVSDGGAIGVANGRWLFPDAIGADTFDINAHGSVGASDVDISWKIRAEPKTGQYGALVRPQWPFPSTYSSSLGGPFLSFFFQVIYEPKV